MWMVENPMNIVIASERKRAWRSPSKASGFELTEIAPLKNAGQTGERTPLAMTYMSCDFRLFT